MNLWLDQILRWGQNAIDGKPVILDNAGSRQQLFIAVLESLAAKEAPADLMIASYDAIPANTLIGLPLSGGLDSLVAYEVAKYEQFDIQPFYVKLNTPYAEAELEAIKKLGIEAKVIDLTIWPKNWLPYQTEWQHILPLRNLAIIVAIAERMALRPGEIWLGATEGEIPHKGGDKSLRFFDAVDTILDSFPIKHQVKFPLRNLTKTDLVKWWIDKKLPIDRLLSSISCQAPEANVACGACHACFNRWVALSNNGLNEPMLSKPWVNAQNAEKVRAMTKALHEHDFVTWSERRIMQTLAAWQRIGPRKSAETTV